MSSSLRNFFGVAFGVTVGLLFSLTPLHAELTPDQIKDIINRSQQTNQAPTATPTPKPADFTPPTLSKANFIPITINGQKLEVMDHPVSVNDWCAYANALGGNGSPYLGIEEMIMLSKVYKEVNNNRHNLIKIVSIKKEDGSEKRYFIPEEGTVNTPLGELEIKDLPVTGVSLYDAACFCNWYNHGQFSGNEGLTSVSSGPYQIVETASYSTSDGKGHYVFHSASKKVNLVDSSATYRLPHYDEISTFFEKNPGNVGPNIKELSDTETPVPPTQIGTFTTYKVVSAGESAASGLNPTLPANQQFQNSIQVSKNRPVPPTERTIDTGFRLVRVVH